MNTPPLPPLPPKHSDCDCCMEPDGSGVPMFDAHQMREYAEAAVRAALEARNADGA